MSTIISLTFDLFDERRPVSQSLMASVGMSQLVALYTGLILVDPAAVKVSEASVHACFTKLLPTICEVFD